MQFGQNVGSNGIGKAQLIQSMDGVRPKRYPGTDFAECRCTLVCMGFDPGPAQSDGRGEPADSSANDNGFHKNP